METYREKLKMQNLGLATGCGILLVFAILASASELLSWNLLPPVTGDEHWRSTWYGYVTGASAGLLGCMGAKLIQNLRAMKDEKKLKKLLIKHQDERTIQICNSARSAAMQVLLPLGLAATVVAGYFNITVAITIFCCLMISSLISIGFSFWFNKHF